MMEEDSWDLDSSSEESDAFSHDSRSEPNVSHRKPNIYTGDTIEYLGDRYSAVRFPSSVCTCKDDGRVGPPQKTASYPQNEAQKPHTHRMMCSGHRRGGSSYAQSGSDMNVDEVFTLLPKHPRKTRQQLRQEKEAAITIQSAWRGCQVRRDIDRMNKAATQVQAAFRGYMTRKELPLGFCCHCRTDGRKLKKRMRAENDRRSFPGFLNCLQHVGFTSGRQPRSLSSILPNDRPRNYPKHMSIVLPNRSRNYPQNIIEDYPLLNPKVDFFQCESACRPIREGFTYTSLNAFARGMQMQRYQDAATTIQAAWRGYQIRQKARPMIRVEKRPQRSFSSNLTIRKASWKHALSGRTVEEHEIRQIFANSELHEGTVSLRKVPRVRNINIYTVVKDMPAPSQRPSISIKVLSPNAVVQGYQRDMSRGVQALYNVKNDGASRPSQILIHVNMQKGKDAPLIMEKK